MIDYGKQIIEALSPILPIYYELFADGKTPKPCITYQEYNNSDTRYGETLGYSAVQFMIKIWANDLDEIATNSLLVDKAMRRLGFHRVSAQELTAGNQICKLLLYEGLGLEDYYE